MSKLESGSRSPMRWVAAGSAALFLLSSAYSVSWGQGINGENNPADDDDGLDSKDLALIGTGAALGVAGLWLLLGGSDDDDDEEEDAKAKAPAEKTGAAGAELRLVPSQNAVAPGERVVLDLQVRNGSEWQSVTEREGAAIQVKGGSGLVAQDGAKNGFCLPITAGYSASSAVIEGRFNGMSASTTVELVAGS